MTNIVDDFPDEPLSEFLHHHTCRVGLRGGRSGTQDPHPVSSSIGGIKARITTLLDP